MATSTKYPTANTATTGFNAVATNPTYAYTDDTNFALIAGLGRNQEGAHNWRGFDFSGLSGTINSVTVKVLVLMGSDNSAKGEWWVSLWPDVTAAAALAPGVVGSIGGVQYTRAAGDTTEFLWDLGTLSTEPTLAQLQGANFGVRVEHSNGNTTTDYSPQIDYIEITVDYTAPSQDKSGSGAIASTASVTATGKKGAEGTGSVTSTAGVTASGTKWEPAYTTVVNLLLAPSLDPTSTYHKLKLRMRGSPGGGDAIVKLLETSTQRATFNPTVTTSWVEYSYTLSTGEANAITAYDDLHVTVEEDPLSTTGWLQVSWIELELSSTSAKSGSGAIGSTAGVTATGVKGATGTATITATAGVTATGTALEFHSGTAAIAATHEVTATGDAVEFHSGSASIIATHTATAAGDAAEAHSGSGSIGSSSSVTASGVKGAEGDASVASTESVTASGVAVEFHTGSGSIAETVDVTASGSAVEFHTGSGSIASTVNVSAIGAKGASDTAAISATVDVTATGTAGEAHSGSGTIGSTAGVTATGVKGATGTATVASTATVTATGVKGALGAASFASTASVIATGVRDDGTNDKSGSGSIASTSTATATGTKQALSESVWPGFPEAFGSDIGAVATVTASGVRDDGSNDKSGSGTITSTASVTASGVKGAAGAASITAEAVIGQTFTVAVPDSDSDGWTDVYNIATNSTDHVELGYESGDGDAAYAWFHFPHSSIKAGDKVLAARIRAIAAETRSGQTGISYQVKIQSTTQSYTIDVSSPSNCWSDLGSRAWYSAAGYWEFPAALTAGEVVYSQDITTEIQYRLDDYAVDAAYDGNLLVQLYFNDADWMFHHKLATFDHATYDAPELSVTIAPRGVAGRTGTASIASTATVTATGVKNAGAVASITSTVSVNAVGAKDDAEAHAGSGTISSTVTVTATGIKGATAVANIATSVTVTATGTTARFGTATIASTGIVTATGSAGTTGAEGSGAIGSYVELTATGVAFYAAGAGDIAATSTVTAAGVKNATAVVVIAATVPVTAVAAKGGAGAGTITAGTVTLTATAYQWTTLVAGTGRGLTDDGAAIGRTDDGGAIGRTDDGTQPGRTSGIHSTGTTR